MHDSDLNDPPIKIRHEREAEKVYKTQDVAFVHVGEGRVAFLWKWRALDVKSYLGEMMRWGRVTTCLYIDAFRQAAN